MDEDYFSERDERMVVFKKTRENEETQSVMIQLTQQKLTFKNHSCQVVCFKDVTSLHLLAKSE